MTTNEFFELLIQAYQNDNPGPLNAALTQATMEDRDHFIEAAERYQKEFGGIADEEPTEE